MDFTNSKDKNKIPFNRNGAKEIPSFKNKRIQDNIKLAKEARQRVRESRRKYNIPIPNVKKEEDDDEVIILISISKMNIMILRLKIK